MKSPVYNQHYHNHHHPTVFIAVLMERWGADWA